jgi:hypothetical protein
MKFWLGAEIDESAYEAFRLARKEVERTLNERLGSKSYDLALDSFDCISVMRGDTVFKERILYSPKRRNMDFRLWMELDEFIKTDQIGQQAQIFAMRIRAADILKSKKGVSSGTMEELKSDMLEIGREMNWV